MPDSEECNCWYSVEERVCRLRPCLHSFLFFCPGVVSLVSSCLVFFQRCVACYFWVLPFLSPLWLLLLLIRRKMRAERQRCRRQVYLEQSQAHCLLRLRLSRFNLRFTIFFFSRLLARHGKLIRSIAPCQTHAVQSTDKSHIVLAIFVISRGT